MLTGLLLLLCYIIIILSPMIKIVIILIIFLLFGVWAGQNSRALLRYIEHIVIDEPRVYDADDVSSTKRFSTVPFMTIGWSELLPTEDKQILSRYQQDLPTDLTDQVVLSLQATTDQNYQATLLSTNTVTKFIDQVISISGFIVPIDVQENRTMTSFFLVPYFGACIHYPPPPPNQLIYVTIPNGMPATDFQMPYTISGVLRKDLYEDPLGTSAYSLDLLTVEKFYEQPDNFRTH
jgi:hypothetical protein